MIQIDSLTEYLHKNGKEPQKVFFNQSQVFVGWKINFPNFDLTYRLNNNELIICDFASTSSKIKNNHAVISFIKFIHEIESSIKHISLVRGILLDSPYPEVTELRQRLAKVLISQGAKQKEIDGDEWLVYPFKNNMN